MIRFSGAIVLAALLAVAASFAQAQQAASPDREAIERIVRDYLLRNPEVLVEAMTELRRRQEAAQEEATRTALAENRAALYEDPASPTAGNVRGDVTIVEFFDYHCGYCKQAYEPLMALLREDSNVRFVFKELPILSPESRIAAAGALAAGRQGKYMEMHEALMTARGRLTRDRVLDIARTLKLDAARLQADMESADVQEAIDSNLRLAAMLGVDGTPAFFIGDQLVPGALDLDQLKALVAEARRK